MFLLNPYSVSSVDLTLTSLLLHFDGADSSTTFTDSSIYANTVSVNTGAPKIKTDIVKFGTGSLFCDLNSSISVPSNPSIDLGSSDFTIEFWYYLNSLPNSVRWFFSRWSGSGSTFQVYSTSGNKLSVNFRASTTVTITSTSNLLASQLEHIAIVRQGSLLTLYRDGVNSGTSAISGALLDELAPLRINGFYTGGGGVDGRIDEFRIRKEAAYTSDFTPPTSAFTF